MLTSSCARGVCQNETNAQFGGEWEEKMEDTAKNRSIKKPDARPVVVASGNSLLKKLLNWFKVLTEKRRHCHHYSHKIKGRRRRPR